MKDKIQLVGENLLPAIGYGDSSGLPVEMKTRAYIIEHFGHIDKLEPVTTNPFFRNSPKGTTSDDTQLSVSDAESLVEVGGFAIEDIARRHTEEYLSSTKGWGGSTRKSMERLLAGVSWDDCGEPDGEGNGVIMKMAPFMYWDFIHPLSEYELLENMSRLTRLTHISDLAIVATLVHHDVGNWLMSGHVAPAEIPEFATSRAKFREQRQFPGAEGGLSTLLGKIASLNELTPESIIDAMPYQKVYGFHVPETLALAYGSFARSPIFPTSTFEVVNLGGDADSTGSIVSAMSIMYQPDVSWPMDIELVEDIERLRDVSKRLAQAALTT